jgi:hypothetical protein
LRKVVIAATAAIFVTACSNDAAPAAAKPQDVTPTVLKGGLYEGSWKVASVQSVDRSAPATKLKLDSSGSAHGCVTADGTIDAALFAEDGDTCKIANPYIRNGRIDMDLTCTRKGQSGEVRQSVSGTFTTDALDAEVSTTTYLSGTGDYAMTRSVSAKRVGECSAAPAAAAEKTS